MASLVKRVKRWFEDSQCTGKKDIPCIVYSVVCLTKNDILFGGKNVPPMQFLCQGKTLYKKIILVQISKFSRQVGFLELDKNNP